MPGCERSRGGHVHRLLPARRRGGLPPQGPLEAMGEPVAVRAPEALAHRSHDEGQAVAAHSGPPAIIEEAARHAVCELGTS